MNRVDDTHTHTYTLLLLHVDIYRELNQPMDVNSHDNNAVSLSLSFPPLLAVRELIHADVRSNSKSNRHVIHPQKVSTHSGIPPAVCRAAV